VRAELGFGYDEVEEPGGGWRQASGGKALTKKDEKVVKCSGDMVRGGPREEGEEGKGGSAGTAHDSGMEGGDREKQRARRKKGGGGVRCLGGE